jgi:hypothetical protein
MSNETIDKEADVELENEMEQLLAKEAEEKQSKAVAPVIEPEAPSPETLPSPAPQAVDVQPEPVTTNESKPEKVQDDPMEWAKKKGFKTPEDMARALLQKEQEFHQSRQTKAEPPPPQQNWNPTPQGFGYQPQPNYGYQPQGTPGQQLAAYYPQLAPEDIDRVMPLIRDAARSIALQENSGLAREVNEMKRATSRNNELMTLMQDPAFRNEGVQREIHAVLESDPSIYQRERTPNTYAFEKALSNLARKQLQQGVTPENSNPKPPVTAGGGNGSANTAPQQLTEQIFNSWTFEQQEAYILSNGRKIPKR